MNSLKFFFLLSFISSQLSVFAQSTCYGLMWSDEFDGNSLDLSKWGYDIGDGCPNLCGWGNGELQYYSDHTNNVRVENGNLIIEVRPDGDGFTSGKITTRNTQSWTYGRFEARMRLPKGRGLWPAFWMLRPNTQWPLTGEIDIMENRGDRPNEVDGTLHYGNPWPNNQWDGTVYHNAAIDFSEDFHVFSIEWDENSISWYVDDVWYKTETREPNSLNPPSGTDPWPWNTDFYLLLNVAVGGWYTGTTNSNDVQLTKPTMEVDYVRVYGDNAALGGQDPFNGQPISVPGRIECEDYDASCAGVAYYDNDGSNQGGEYRSDAVDIETSSDASGAYNIGWTQDGEWLEYTVNVSKTGNYNIGIRSASETQGGAVSLEIDGQPLTNVVDLPITGGWQQWESTTVLNVPLTAGEHVLRMNINQGAVNLNYIDVADAEVSGLNHLSNLPLSLYPIPAKSFVMLNTDGVTNAEVKVTDLAGKVWIEDNEPSSTRLDLSTLPSGSFIVEMKKNDGKVLRGSLYHLSE